MLCHTVLHPFVAHPHQRLLAVKLPLAVLHISPCPHTSRPPNQPASMCESTQSHHQHCLPSGAVSQLSIMWLSISPPGPPPPRAPAPAPDDSKIRRTASSSCSSALLICCSMAAYSRCSRPERSRGSTSPEVGGVKRCGKQILAGAHLKTLPLLQMTSSNAGTVTLDIKIAIYYCRNATCLARTQRTATHLMSAWRAPTHGA